MELYKEEDMVVSHITMGTIPVEMVDYSGKGAWASGVLACKAYVKDACGIMDLDPVLWTPGMVTIAGRETSWNASGSQVNDYDSNAVGAYQSDGHRFQCSRGGWQCIPQTFAANHQAGTSYQIYDPVASVAAAMNYVMKRYGVSRDAHDLASKVQQADPNRPSRGY